METWHFRPQTNVVESVEWLTDVRRCKVAEYRRAMRTIPRIGYTFSHKMWDPREFATAREIARKVGGDDLYVPDWPTHEQIPSINAGTVSLPIDASDTPALKSGAHAMVWESWDKWEAVAVTGINTGTISVSATTSAYVRPIVVALRVGNFTQAFDGDRQAGEYTFSSASFLCLDTEDLAGTTTVNWTTYKDAPVMTDAVKLLGGIKNTSTRDVETIDSRTGPVYKYAVHSSASQESALAWNLKTYAQLHAFRLWLHDMKGRFKSMWCPSWNTDLTITSNVAINDTTIEIAKVGAGYAATYPDNSDFVVITGGAPLCFRVTDVAAGSAGREVLTLESPALTTVNASSTPSACRLLLSRFDSDQIVIQHKTGRTADVVIPIVEIPVYP